MKREIPALLLALILWGCETRAERFAAAREKTGGEPQRGVATLRKYGCDGCHTIPGVGTASLEVGPSLAGFGSRTQLAGQLPNTPANLLRWIRFPRSIDPHTRMPDVGVTEPDARDIAAYLYALTD